MAQSISVNFRANTSQFSKGLGKVQGGIKKMSGAVKGLIGTFAGVGIGIAGTVGYFQKFRTEMDQVDKYAKSFGESTESIQRLGLGAELTGSNMGNLVNAMAKVKRSITEADMGTKTYQRAMEALGLSSEELMQLPMDKQLQKLGAAYNNTSNKTAAFAHISTLMGRSAKELIPLLKEVGNAQSETSQAMTGMEVVSDETIQGMVRFNDMITQLKQKFQVFFGKIVESAMNTWDFIVAAWKGGTLGGIIKEALIIAAKSWVNFTYKNFMAIIKTFGTAIGNSFKAQVAIFKGIFASIPEIIDLLKKGFTVVGDFLVNAILQGLNGIEMFGKKLVSDALAEASSANLRDSMGDFGKAAKAAGESMAPYAKEAAGYYADTGREFMKNRRETKDLFNVDENAEKLKDLVAETKKLIPESVKAASGEGEGVGTNSGVVGKEDTLKDAKRFMPLVSSIARIGGASGLANVSVVKPMVREQQETNKILQEIKTNTKSTTTTTSSGANWQ